MNKKKLIAAIEQSRALKAKLARNPEWADDAARNFGRRLEKSELESALCLLIGAGAGEAAFKKAIRDFKYKNLLRIAAADMCGALSVSELLAEWSDVADIIIDAAYRFALDSIGAKTGFPKDCVGSVVALGKLGGRELNISSDVDLLFIYTADSADASFSNHDFFVKLASLATKLLSEVTEDGFAYRVDHELRPEGPQGPLANSLDAMLRYYECFGHGWERQAFIRARPVAGDLGLGNKLIEGLRPFVYRRSISVSDISHMREMKNRMEADSYNASSLRNIKTGPGGIREAEFLVQALQSLNGGADADVRRTNTFDAIDALEKKSLIHPFGAALLKNAYSFLRHLENMIQLADDVQTHRLPHGEPELASLARRMGYKEKESAGALARLEADITHHTRGVQILFHALFESDYDRQELEDALSDNLSRATNEEEEADSLAWFVRGEKLRLARMDLEEKIELKRLLERLSIAADVALKFAWKTSVKNLEARFGKPLHSDGSPASFAIVGMGKLGSREIDYGSDLDLCFLYSGAGETSGPAVVSNIEYFTKLAQRIITIISLATRYGRAFAVDSELRPSGRSGALVATLDSFSEYHRTSARIWEKIALLKARVVAGDGAFVSAAKEELAKLSYNLHPPSEESAAGEILQLREKALKEKASGRGAAINIKYCRGGISDLDSVIRFHQLMNASSHEALQRQNTFDVVGALASAMVIDGELQARLLAHLVFYRRLLSRIRLVTQSSTDIIELKSPIFETIALQMNAASAAELASQIEAARNSVENIFAAAIKTK